MGLELKYLLKIIENRFLSIEWLRSYTIENFANWSSCRCTWTESPKLLISDFCVDPKYSFDWRAFKVEPQDSESFSYRDFQTRNINIG